MTNETTTALAIEQDRWDNATWILTSAWVILTMQAGFGLLEAGSVSKRNETNIMMKNVADVVFGGIAYWAVGFGLSYGEGGGSNAFAGSGSFFLDGDPDSAGSDSEWLLARFFFQYSFAATATTIVSGALAERTRFSAYLLFSTLNVIIYAIPVHWIWADNGWLNQLGFVDFAGDAAVHLVGGVTALVGTMYMGPRVGRQEFQAHNPSSVLFGLFMLFFGWYGFNCGSTFGITGNLWRLSTKAAVTTTIAGIGGGIVGVMYTRIRAVWYCIRHWRSIRSHFQANSFPYDVSFTASGLIGGLVGITASCPFVSTPDSLVIGTVGGLMACAGEGFIFRRKIDDPVNAVAVHGFSSIWGIIATGLFAQSKGITADATSAGLFYGGNARFLGIQMLGLVAVIAWAAVMSLLCFFVVDKLVGLRMTASEELTGADATEHDVQLRITHSSTRVHPSGAMDAVLDVEEAESSAEQFEGVVPGESNKKIPGNDTARDINWRRLPSPEPRFEDAKKAATTDSVLASPARMTSRVDPEEEASDGNSSVS